jgi:arginyl-tRNA--protein-N-Asp/Glu arginylyltransferase
MEHRMSDPRFHAAARWQLPLFPGRPHPCAYLPGRTAENIYGLLSHLDARFHQHLMDTGFRRSGNIVYRPACEGCRECTPIRVPVADFIPSRSQRRAQRKNTDVTVTVAPPMLTDEKHALYARYLRAMHDGAMGDTREELNAFLYQSCTDTLEMTYRADGRLLAVGIVDVTPKCLSSVYFFFDPDECRRSLGVFGALEEIAECRRRGLPYWYIGYYVAGCRRMNYKAQYRPCEVLGPDGVWRSFAAPALRP